MYMCNIYNIYSNITLADYCTMGGCEAGAGEIYSLARYVRFDVILMV